MSLSGGLSGQQWAKPFERGLWCKYYELSDTTHVGSWSTVDAGQVAPRYRDNGPDTAVPPSPPNGGLYGGPQSTGPWANIPVTPTMTNMIENNLLSANPPPEATKQYIGTVRLGNNYISMPSVSWYNPNIPEMSGKYSMQVINASH